MAVDLEIEATDGIFHRTRVQDVLTHALALGRPDTPAQELAVLMRDQGVGSVVVVDDDLSPLGIVTERDLVYKVVAGDMGHLSARDVMSSPAITVGPRDPLAEALYLMTRHRCRRLVVATDGRVSGVLSMRDLLRLGGHERRGLAARIEGARDVETLRNLRRQVDEFVRRLYLAEVDAPTLGEMVTDMNDAFVRRTIRLNVDRLVDEQQPQPRPFSWVSFGSDGRREQVLRGDQDNGVIVAGQELDSATRGYFARLSGRINEDLATLGFSICQGDVMAREEKYSGSAGEWQERIFVMVHRSHEGEGLRDLSILADLRLVQGDPRLVARLWGFLLAQLERYPPAIRALAKDAAEKPSGLNLLGRLQYEKSRDGVKGVNIKRYGLLPLTAGVKAMALEEGITAITTPGRLRSLEESRRLDRQSAASLLLAHQLLLRLKLHGSIEQVFHGRGAPYFFYPDQWTEWDREQLREALRAVSKLRDLLRARFIL